MKIHAALPMLALLALFSMVGAVCAQSADGPAQPLAQDAGPAAPTGDSMQPPEQGAAPPPHTLQLPRKHQRPESSADPAPSSAEKGRVRCLTGGIGETEWQAMEGRAHAYSLKLLFAAERAYLSDVAVRLTDSKGQMVLDTVSKGPMLLVQLPPGRYTLEARGPNGHVLTQRLAIGQGLATHVLRFPASEL